MSKRQAKAQASSNRATVGGFSGGFGQSPFSAGFGGAPISPLSYVAEPPDFSSIVDPNLVVAFKNLSKKDSTTKAKALEDIQAYVTSPSRDQIEDGVLEAWVKLFPRTSIDNTRRVRQLAQALNGQLCAACGKRIAKYLPNIVAAWLAGQSDSDTAVSRDSQASLNQVFSTSEKQYNLLKAYQEPILEYYRNVLQNETAQTLSDERTVSPDDADAKYSRVIATSIAGVSRLVATLKQEDRAKFTSIYDSITLSEKLWQFASAKDILIRREINKLLRACLRTEFAMDWTIISTEFIYRGLHSDQTGSSHELVETLIAATTHRPEIWLKDYTAKKPAVQRLQHFLKNGSQHSPLSFWKSLTRLFEALPKELLPEVPEGTSELLKALESGITRKEEIRARQSDGYCAYMDIADVLLERLAIPGQRQIVSEIIWPRVSQFILPSAGTVTVSNLVVTKSLDIGAMAEIVRFKWSALTDSLIANMNKMEQELPKEHERLQKEVFAQGKGWIFALDYMLGKKDYLSVKPVLDETLQKLVTEAISILKRQNGKQVVLAKMLKLICNWSKFAKESASNEKIRESLRKFAEVDCPELISTPSFEDLATLVVTIDNIWHTDAWSVNLEAALNAPDIPIRDAALRSLIKADKSGKASQSPQVQEWILQQADLALMGRARWDPLTGFMSSNNTASSHTADTILTRLVNSLTIEDHSAFALSGVKAMIEQNPQKIKEFTSQSQGSKLVSNLLLLSESPTDSIAHDAIAVSSSLRSLLSGKPVKEVIQQGLCDASPNSASIMTLVDFSTRTLKSLGSEAEAVETLLELLPDPEIWRKSLAPFLRRALPSEFAITDSLRGAIYFVRADEKISSISGNHPVPRDLDGYSIPLRMAYYTERLFRTVGDTVKIFADLPQERAKEYFTLLSLTSNLAGDNLGFKGANDIWILQNHDIEEDMMKFVSLSQNLLRDLRDNRDDHSFTTPENHAFVLPILNELFDQISDFSPEAWNYAREYASLKDSLAELENWDAQKIEVLESQLRELRKRKNTISIVAFIVGNSIPLSKGKYMIRVCNELVADLTALNFASRPDDALSQLVQLNCILQEIPDMAATIAKQRLIFFVKHLVNSLKNERGHVTLPILSELYRALGYSVPMLNDIYGDHWNDIMESVATFWIQDSPFKPVPEVLPAVHSSLKLYAALTSLKSDEDTNDDLLDVLKDTEEVVFKGMLTMMEHQQDVSDEYRQPLRIVNELLSRAISKSPVRYLQDPAEIFPLLSSESPYLQLAVFRILHEYIPTAQEKISFDAALENQVAQLPEELLSLILQSPDPNQVLALASDAVIASVPISLRCYLLSWQLIFDHFKGSSYKVQTDYIAYLKSGDYLAILLDFIASVLGHTIGKPVDVSSFSITEEVALDDISSLRDIQACLAHYYFLSLKHLPSIAKAWWIECTRQTSLSIESWTEKFISPHVIADALQSVSDWSAKQDAAAADETLSIKVAPRVREITASYEVDEQPMSMLIRLPASYPLHNATVEGVHRVAVSEKKWQMWLVNAQGVITFSNNSLTDGLLAWRRNVVAALKGHSECAICYSLVSADKQLPSKRCQTCKNLFHGSCLFKWFKTSNASTCPLCRTAFNYG